MVRNIAPCCAAWSHAEVRGHQMIEQNYLTSYWLRAPRGLQEASRRQQAPRPPRGLDDDASDPKTRQRGPRQYGSTATWPLDNFRGRQDIPSDPLN
eukprot:1990330-Pyramimonas_sp.AAC.1